MMYSPSGFSGPCSALSECVATACTQSVDCNASENRTKSGETGWQKMATAKVSSARESVRS